MKIDPKISIRIWKSMIKGFIDYEFEILKKIIIYYEAGVFFDKKLMFS